MDEQTAWEMVEALSDIAEILGLKNVDSAQIVQAVKDLKQKTLKPCFCGKPVEDDTGVCPRCQWESQFDDGYAY